MKYIHGHKSYKDSTLKSMTKADLIDEIRCLETSIEQLIQTNNNQYNVLLKYDKSLDKACEVLSKVGQLIPIGDNNAIVALKSKEEWKEWCLKND